MRYPNDPAVSPRSPHPTDSRFEIDIKGRWGFAWVSLDTRHSPRSEPLIRQTLGSGGTNRCNRFQPNQAWNRPSGSLDRENPFLKH